MDDGSPFMRAKIQKLNNMKHILNELFVIIFNKSFKFIKFLLKFIKFIKFLNFFMKNQKLITQKQLKLFNYLYLAEDINILSVYELYLLTS